MKHNKEHSKVKCDCGHLPKEHHNREGSCKLCACTWYYPNVNYIVKKQSKQKWQDDPISIY